VASTTPLEGRQDGPGHCATSWRYGVCSAHPGKTPFNVSPARPNTSACAISLRQIFRRRCIEAKQRKRQSPADLFEHVDQQRLLAHQKRRKFRLTGRNIRHNERLHECTIRHRTGVRDDSLNKARRRIAPVREGPNRN
jgi:hypothetical protein